MFLFFFISDIEIILTESIAIETAESPAQVEPNSKLEEIMFSSNKLLCHAFKMMKSDVRVLNLLL